MKDESNLIIDQRMKKLKDGWTEKQLVGRTDRWTQEWMDGQTKGWKDVWMHKGMDGRTMNLMDGQ